MYAQDFGKPTSATHFKSNVYMYAQGTGKAAGTTQQKFLVHTYMVARETVRPCATLCRGPRGWHKVTRHKVPRHKVAGTRSWHKVAGTRFGPQKQTSSIQWVGSFRLVAPRGGQVLPLFENEIKVPVDMWDACRSATRRRRSARVKKMNKKEGGKTITPETQAMVKKTLDQHSYISGHLWRNRKRQRDEQVRVLVQSKRHIFREHPELHSHMR
jgi:hypothetical protein